MPKFIDAPSAEEFINKLRETLKYCEEADDSGSIDGCMAEWQQWVDKWPTITEDGGI